MLDPEPQNGSRGVGPFAHASALRLFLARGDGRAGCNDFEWRRELRSVCSRRGRRGELCVLRWCCHVLHHGVKDHGHVQDVGMRVWALYHNILHLDKYEP